MVLTLRQTDLWRDRAPSAADYRAAAEAALMNPFESPERCEQRAAYYLAMADSLEPPTCEATRPAPGSTLANRSTP